jgi:hypothetical protein
VVAHDLPPSRRDGGRARAAQHRRPLGTPALGDIAGHRQGI